MKLRHLMMTTAMVFACQAAKKNQADSHLQSYGKQPAQISSESFQFLPNAIPILEQCNPVLLVKLTKLGGKYFNVRVEDSRGVDCDNPQQTNLRNYSNLTVEDGEPMGCGIIRVTGSSTDKNGKPLALELLDFRNLNAKCNIVVPNPLELKEASSQGVKAYFAIQSPPTPQGEFCGQNTLESNGNDLSGICIEVAADGTIVAGEVVQADKTLKKFYGDGGDISGSTQTVNFVDDETDKRAFGLTVKNNEQGQPSSGFGIYNGKGFAVDFKAAVAQ